MAETTPLLPRAKRRPLAQKKLLAVRAVVASFLSIVLALAILYGINYTQRGEHFVFEATNVSLVIQTLYYWTTMSWTLQHILAPYGRLPQEEQAKGNFLAQIQASLSVPTSTDTSSKRYYVFSTFYTASVTIPFAVSVAYWLVLYPSGPVLDQESNGRILHRFVLISTTVLNSGIAFVEIMALSSVQKQKDLATEVASVIAIYLLYAMWTVIGRFITGEYVYECFDPDYAGWAGIATTDIVILSLMVTVFFAQRGLHELREMLAWEAEGNLSGR